MMTLRDHSQPCEHPEGHRQAETRNKRTIWRCFAAGCPGGKEIVLRLTTLKDHTVKPDDVMYVEADDE